MRENPKSQSGIFTPRILATCTLCSAGVFLAIVSFGATLPSGMTGLAANSPGDSSLVGKHAGPLNGRAKAASTPLTSTTGGSWRIATSPTPSDAQTHNHFYGVMCVSTSDCWAVGSYYTGSVNQTLVEHWDGTAAAVVHSSNASPTQDNYLFVVTCVSASDCWAVGYYNANHVTQTLAEHWDGGVWAIVASANTSVTSDDLNLVFTNRPTPTFAPA